MHILNYFHTDLHSSENYTLSSRRAQYLCSQTSRLCQSNVCEPVFHIFVGYSHFLFYEMPPSVFAHFSMGLPVSQWNRLVLVLYIFGLVILCQFPASQMSGSAWGLSFYLQGHLLLTTLTILLILPFIFVLLVLCLRISFPYSKIMKIFPHLFL